MKKSLLFKGKWKLLAYNFRVKRSSPIFLVLEAWVPRRIPHGPSDLVWKSKWEKRLETGWGRTLQFSLPTSPGFCGNDQWQLQSSLPKASLKQTKQLLFDSAVYCHSYMKRKKYLARTDFRMLPKGSFQESVCHWAVVQSTRGNISTQLERAPFLCKQHLP